MMAYDSQFVICVLHNGHVVRESNGGIAYLPYDSQYKIRLKNKHSYLRAKAKVWIDGRPVSNLGDFILQAGEALDLERFLDHSMSEGRRFKFVPLSDSRVADPTDHENGIIKVEFYREKKHTPPIRPQPTVTRGHTEHRLGPGYDSDYYIGSKSSYTTASSWVSYNNNENLSLLSNSIAPITNDMAGATIEGGHSEQGFAYGDGFQTEHYPVTLTIRLKGIQRARWEDEFDRSPPRRLKRINFCPGCGVKRRRMDKFCHRCGTAYHPRYENERGHVSR